MQKLLFDVESFACGSEYRKTSKVGGISRRKVAKEQVAKEADCYKLTTKKI